MTEKRARPVILVQGGAGAILPERREVVQRGCLEAARIGFAVLLAGGDAVGAVVEAVAALEANPQFNAGRGAALTHAGTIQLDAAVMRGTDRAVGAVGCVTRICHPVRLARAVLDTEHVLLVGPWADAFGESLGLEVAGQDYFLTERQRRRLEEHLRGGESPGPGTVGAVALDMRGGLAAATSTGGRVGQRPGRVGDTPIVGAGTYADSRGAASGTGIGEYFMRTLAAYVAVQALVSATPQEASERGVAAVAELGGGGGLVVLGRDGRVGVAFNTDHLSHAWVRDDEEYANVDPVR